MWKSIGKCLCCDDCASSGGSELKTVELLAKGSHRNPHTAQADAKIKGCSLQTNRRGPIAKTIPIQHTEHGEVGWVPT